MSAPAQQTEFICGKCRKKLITDTGSVVKIHVCQKCGNYFVERPVKRVKK